MSAERRAEARKVSIIFHSALIMLGADAAIDALDDWQDVANTPASIVASVARYLNRALALTSAARQEARTLALAYLRYSRALQTGFTFDGPQGAELGLLRDEFYETVWELAPGLLEPDGSMIDDDTGEVIVEGPEPFDFEIEVEPLPEINEDELDELSEIILREQIAESAVESLERHQPKPGLPADDVDAQRDEARVIAGSIVGQAVQREVVGAGREKVKETGLKDKRVMAFARVSKTGTPCGFCAMLISRGPVYKSAASAVFTKEGGQYHGGCNCIEVEVYSIEQYNEDPRFDLNRGLSKEWPGVTSGLGGKSALSAWRKHIRQKFKADRESV